jgi:hypothetical protein
VIQKCDEAKNAWRDEVRREEKREEREERRRSEGRKERRRERGRREEREKEKVRWLMLEGDARLTILGVPVMHQTQDLRILSICHHQCIFRSHFGSI